MTSFAAFSHKQTLDMCFIRFNIALQHTVCHAEMWLRYLFLYWRCWGLVVTSHDALPLCFMLFCCSNASRVALCTLDYWRVQCLTFVSFLGLWYCTVHAFSNHSIFIYAFLFATRCFFLPFTSPSYTSFVLALVPIALCTFLSPLCPSPCLYIYLVVCALVGH